MSNFRIDYGIRRLKEYKCDFLTDRVIHRGSFSSFSYSWMILFIKYLCVNSIWGTVPDSDSILISVLYIWYAAAQRACIYMRRHEQSGISCCLTSQEWLDLGAYDNLNELCLLWRRTGVINFATKITETFICSC